MRKSLIEVFEVVLNNLFSASLEAVLSPSVRDEFYSVLSTRGVHRKDVPVRFDDVVKILNETFGALGAKVIVHKVIVDLHREYGQSTDFPYAGTLQDKLYSLREKVVIDHIWPRQFEDADLFYDKQSVHGEEGSDNDSVDQAILAGLYRYKKGVGSNPTW